jgi:hypothetical protein
MAPEEKNQGLVFFSISPAIKKRTVKGKGGGAKNYGSRSFDWILRDLNTLKNKMSKLKT